MGKGFHLFVVRSVLRAEAQCCHSFPSSSHDTPQQRPFLILSEARICPPSSSLMTTCGSLSSNLSIEVCRSWRPTGRIACTLQPMKVGARSGSFAVRRPSSFLLPLPTYLDVTGNTSRSRLRRRLSLAAESNPPSEAKPERAALRSERQSTIHRPKNRPHRCRLTSSTRETDHQPPLSSPQDCHPAPTFSHSTHQTPAHVCAPPPSVLVSPSHERARGHGVACNDDNAS